MILRLLAIVMGFAAAVLTGVLAGVITGLPFIDAVTSEQPPFWRLANGSCTAALFALPFAFAAILAAEARRWRSWVYWAGVGILTGLCGYAAFKNMGSAAPAAMTAGRAPWTFVVMGFLGGLAYWAMAGRNAGQLSDAVFRFVNSDRGGEKGERRRCVLCTLLGLAAGALPLLLLGWHAFHRPVPPLAQSITAKAEADAERLLKEAGLANLTFKVGRTGGQDYIGHVSGKVPDQQSKSKAFKSATAALAPLTGLPGIVAVLQDDIIAENEADPAVAAENARIRAAEAAEKEAEEKAKQAAEAQAKLKAEAEAKRKAEEARLAAEAEAKLKAEAEAKRKAEEARLAAEAEAKLKAEAEAKRKAEEARLAAEAEAKLKAEAEAKRKAEEARLAAEAEAKLKAEAEAKKKAEEARLAAEARLKAEESAKQRAEDEKARLARLAAEAEANKKWQAEMKQAAEEEKVRLARLAAEAMRTAEQPVDPATPAAPRSEGMEASKVARANCVAEFGQHFAAGALRFAQNSSALSVEQGPFLDKLAEIAKRCEGIGVIIQGNTDAWGDGGYNQALSEERAEAVRAALVERGVVSDRLAARGFGNTKLLDPARNRNADKVNRRVDFSVVEIESLPRERYDHGEKSLKD